MIQSIIEEIKHSAIFIDNPEELHLEDAIGSDVSQVHLTEQHAMQSIQIVYLIQKMLNNHLFFFATHLFLHLAMTIS